MNQKQLIARIQAKEDRERTARCRRLVRALKAVPTRFHHDELTQLEAIIERVYGRAELSG
jgi:hypothetical protein